ncbi:XIAP-associated factor 1 [Embiotoca jacksoni]|uniref:XIAP-associated factor 1 n=1 Tax=Embiotoca jacksoni TaxID=100190 RepID=UPI0037045CD4
MDNKEATRTCGQCHKEVAEANFDLHETHCSRFLCLCPDCNEPVPKDQLSQHREEQHTQVRCSKCHQKMERCRLMDHEADECAERLQICQFCELELPCRQLDEHRLACGSRTELCRDCGLYVRLRDQPEHGRTCSDADDGSGPPQTGRAAASSRTKKTVICPRCVTSFPAEDVDKHECVPASRWYDEEAMSDEEEEEEEDEEEEEEEEERGILSPGASPQLVSSFKVTSASVQPSQGPGGDPNQISICPYCHLALPVATLRWHTRKCKLFILLK